MDGRKTEAVIFDMDGTLALCDHRRHFLDDNNWAAFNAAMGDDTPNLPVIMIARALHAQGYDILISTGREATAYVKRLTGMWCAMHHIPYMKMYMRAEKDYRQDGIVKREMLYQMRADGYNPVLAVDDRQSVVDMWREEGLVCLQCAPGFD